MFSHGCQCGATLMFWELFFVSLLIFPDWPVVIMMIAFITLNSSLVPMFEGLWSSNPWEFELSGFRRNRTDDLGIDSPSLWPTEPRLHVRTIYSGVDCFWKNKWREIWTNLLLFDRRASVQLCHVEAYLPFGDLLVDSGYHTTRKKVLMLGLYLSDLSWIFRYGNERTGRCSNLVKSILTYFF